MQQTRDETVSLAYAVSGQGPWLVLSHPLASDSRIWEPQLPLLEKHFTVLRIDTRGHGGSPAPGGAYTMGGLAEDAFALLQRLDAKPVTWVGLSLGGMIGQALAVRHPDMIERLVLADTTAGYPAEAKGAWADRIAAVEAGGMAAVAEASIGRWFGADFRAREPETVARIREVILATPPTGFIGCGQAIRDLDLWDEIGSIGCPTLVLVGEQDGATPPAMARRIAETIPRATLTLIPDAAHISCVENAPAFNRALAAFLKIG